MTPAKVAHIMALLDQYVRACKGVTNYENVMAAKAVRDKLEAALRDAPQQAEIDAITELNHAQWLALENVRHLAARNRKEEWAQHMLRWCTEAGNAARILRATPSAPTAVEPDERAEFEAWCFKAYSIRPEFLSCGKAYKYDDIRKYWIGWQANAFSEASKSGDLLIALEAATNALSGGLWDYGPGQDEHTKCNEVIAQCRAVIEAARASK